MKCDGPACGLDRCETSAGDFLGLDELLDQAKAAWVGECVEDMLKINDGRMIGLIHGLFFSKGVI